MKYLVVDIESSKLPTANPWQPGSFICSVGYRNETMGDVAINVIRHATEFTRPLAVTVLEIQAAVNAADIIVAHNVKFDISWLKYIGINFTGKKFWCTCTADYMINGQAKMGYKLNQVAARYGLGQKLDAMAQYWADGYETDEIPLDVHLEYLAQDVNLTHELFLKQYKIAEENSLMKLCELVFEVSDMLSDMEMLGIEFDKPKAEAYLADYKSKLIELDKKIFEFVGYEFNIGSAQQLSACLYGGYVTKEGRETYTVTLKNGTTKERSRNCKITEHVQGLGFEPIAGTEGAKAGQFSTGKKIIVLLHAKTKEQKHFLNLLLERSKIDKIIETFLTAKEDSGLLMKIGKDGRIHPQFNQTVTVTGRLSSSNPNGQNLPRKGSSPIKKCFFSKNGVLLNCDLAQIEFRIAAELSRDPVMLKEIKDGLDTHTDNAIRFFEADKYNKDSDEFKVLRNNAKTLTFRLLFGGTAGGFYRDGSMPRFPLKKWEKIVAAYYEKYADLRKWQQENLDKVYSVGYLRNPSGRVLKFPLTTKQGIKQYDEACIDNYPIQSSSADVLFLLMVTLRNAFRKLGLKSQFVLSVHDSLVIDAFKNEVDTITKLASDMFVDLPNLCKEYWDWDMDVPLSGDVEVGYTYGEMTPISVKTSTATKCVLTFADGTHEELNVTKYLDLETNEDYKNLTAERKLAKITLC